MSEFIPGTRVVLKRVDHGTVRENDDPDWILVQLDAEDECVLCQETSLRLEVVAQGNEGE